MKLAALLFEPLLGGVKSGALSLKGLSILGLEPAEQQLLFVQWFFGCSLDELLMVSKTRIHTVFSPRVLSLSLTLIVVFGSECSERISYSVLHV